MKKNSILVVAGILMMIAGISITAGQEKENILFGGKDYTVQMEFTAKYQKEIETFSEGYMDFLGLCKTTRECVTYFKAQAERDGFMDWEQFNEQGTSPEPGDRFYFDNRQKNLVLFIIGDKPLEEGIHQMVSHLDANHLYLKFNPLYEKLGFGLAHTKIFGGIKKFQWLSQPLAIHGVVYTREGKRVDIVIGEDENDPVFTIPDIAAHMSSLNVGGEHVKAEQMDLLLASTPAGDGDKGVKAYVLDYLDREYGIVEEDFISAEIELVPATKPRVVGLDRALIGGFGQDDKVCSYVQYRAIREIEIPKHTCFVDLSDKEEVGWSGTTGIRTYKIERLIGQIVEKMTGQANINIIRDAFENGYSLNADVTAAVNPLFPQPHELQNVAALGFGPSLWQTGDHAEFWWKLRDMLIRSGSIWQTGDFRQSQSSTEHFSVPPGETGMDTIYFGFPLISMHTLFELTHKADLYSAYMAYKFFLQDELMVK